MAGVAILERYRHEPVGLGVYLAFGVVWFVTLWTMDRLGEPTEATRLFVAAAFMTGLGLLCVWNASKCDALHCRISGPAYILVAALGVAGAFGLVPLGVGDLYLLFGVAAAVGYLAEFVAPRLARTT